MDFGTVLIGKGKFLTAEGVEVPSTLSERAAKMQAEGFTYSYDMLGEAARTDADALRYLKAYSDAIASIASHASGNDIRTRPGISVKLSALHPCYDVMQRDRVLGELVPRLQSLLRAAAKADIGLNIDAEEADRLDLSLDVIEAAMADPDLAGWDGFGIVVQAYGLRAGDVIDHLYRLSETYDRKLMVRLVKGAYWDTEIKLAQVQGMERFPVFTSKAATDVSYIANARKLLGMTDRIYPQFATHNAHTVAAILHMNSDPHSFEFQRLHGMGERLHDIVHGRENTAAVSTHPWAHTAIFWPILSAACLRTARTPASSTRSWTSPSRPKPWPPTPLLPSRPAPACARAPTSMNRPAAIRAAGI